MRRVACLWLPHWPLQRLLNDQPQWKGKPVVLYEASRGLRVVDRSQEAADFGIRPGMPLAEASALVGSRPVRTRPGERRPPEAVSLHTIPYDPIIDRSALEELACQCERFTPLVGLETASPPECLLLDVTGCDRAFRGEAALVREIEAACRRWGYTVQVALADTVGAAWACARYSRFVDLRKFPALRIGSGKTAEALAPLPTSSLRLERTVVDVLRQLGIETVGQLMGLPREELASRFGAELLLRLQQALGEKPEVVHPYRGMPTLEAGWELEAPTGSLPIVERVLLQLLEQLILQFPAGYGSQRLEIQLYGEGEETELVLETYSPSSCRLHWQKLLRLRMESLRLTRPVEKVQLRATALAPMEARQMELFSGAPRERPEELADLLDRLSSRLGRQAVLRPRPVADVQPEYACRYTPVIAEGKEKASRTKTSPAPTKPDSKEDLYRHRPLRLCSEPIALPVVSIVPEGPPLRFQWEDHEYQVVQAWGPERIETGWWRGGRIARDYYRLETQTGLRLWIFRRRRDGQWFLQGWFD